MRPSAAPHGASAALRPPDLLLAIGYRHLNHAAHKGIVPLGFRRHNHTPDRRSKRRALQKSLRNGLIDKPAQLLGHYLRNHHRTKAINKSNYRLNDKRGNRERASPRDGLACFYWQARSIPLPIIAHRARFCWTGVD